MQGSPRQTFAALADPTRLAIVERLRHGPATLTEVGRPLDMTLPAVLKHVRVLEANGLVEGHRTGRTRHLRLRAAPLREAMDYLATYRRFWESRLDALGDYLDRNDPADPADRTDPAHRADPTDHPPKGSP